MPPIPTINPRPKFGYCECGTKMKRLNTCEGDPEGIRRDQQCPDCGNVYGCTKAHQSILRRGSKKRKPKEKTMPQKTDLKFESFNTEGGWNSFDRLGNYRLQSGEFVVIKWPNGKEEKVCVSVMRRSDTVQDMGTPALVTFDEAFATIDHQGCMMTVRLCDLKGIRGASLMAQEMREAYGKAR